jgi:ATP-dependent helicase HrpA
VVANEQVTLFGLPIVQDRRVAYGRIDPEQAADIFIRSALVSGDVKQPLGFMRHNAALVDAVRGVEDRIRRRDILVEDEVLVAFYKERLPNVTDMRTLAHCIRQKGSDQFLRLNREMLVRYLPDAEVLDQFPRKLDLGNRVLDCDYAFEPGAETDGVTLTVPAEAAGDIPRQQLDWLVPGLLADKITALIKGLPKTHRVKLVPVANTVQLILKAMPRGRESLPTALSRFLFQHLQVDIPASAWPMNELPEHLKMRVAITDAKGRVMASGRGSGLLDRTVSAAGLPDGMQDIKQQWERQGITVWDFGDLPQVLTVDKKKGRTWQLYPRLAVEEGRIHLRLFNDPKTAEQSHREGVAALLAQHFADDLKFLKRNLKLPVLLKRQTVYFGGQKAVENQLYQQVTKELFSLNVLTAAAFEARVGVLADMRVHQCGQAMRDATIAVIEAHHEAQCRIRDVEKKRIAAPVMRQFLQTVKEELTRLVPDTFVLLYDRQRLLHVVRYLKAVSVRAQRGYTDLEKDRSRQALVAPFIEHLHHLLQSMDESTSVEKRAAVEDYFWMIEEYKVSVFAQEVGTDGPVSAKRLKQRIGEIGRMV